MKARSAVLTIILLLVASCESSSSTTTAGTSDAAVGDNDSSVSETPDAVFGAEDDGSSELDAAVDEPDTSSGTVDDTQITPDQDTGPSNDVTSDEDAGAVDPDAGPDVAPEEDIATDQDAGPACSPDCEGKLCGPDGCGGECGACAGGELCTLGLCSSPGACTNDADGGVLASIDVAKVVEGCAKGCILDSDKAACGGDCLVEEAGLSADCAACFGGNVACAFTKCTFECGFGSVESCLDCQSKAGCFVEFESCAGLPPP